MERVIAYVDGYNLYYGLREKRWKRFYWLNIQTMVGHLLKPGQAHVTTKYFTTIIKRPEDRRRRQAVFLEVLQTLDDFQIWLFGISRGKATYGGTPIRQIGDSLR